MIKKNILKECELCGKLVMTQFKWGSGKARVRHKCSHGLWCPRGDRFLFLTNEPKCKECFKIVRTRDLKLTKETEK